MQPEGSWQQWSNTGHLCLLVWCSHAHSAQRASRVQRAPPTATATLSVWSLLLEGLDAIAVAREPQSTLLEAAEGRLDLSLTEAGLDFRHPA